MTAWTSGAKAEARKWYEIATERFPCREALICLGMLTSDNDDLERAESLLRAAIAAEESPKETYLMFDPPEYALDLARVTLARVLQTRGAGTLERTRRSCRPGIWRKPIHPRLNFRRCSRR